MPPIPLQKYWTSPNGARQTTRFIAFHHAAFTYPVGGAALSIYNYHRSRWPAYAAAGYHVICQQDADGIHAYQVNPHDMQGAGVAGRNHETYHVCAATNFTGLPSADWFEASALALAEAKQRYPQAQIVGHKEIALPGYETACPGPRWLDWKPQLLARVNELLADSSAITPDSQIISSARCTKEKALQYMTSRPHGAYTEYDLETSIIPAYFHVCTQVGIDPCIALAQVIYETANLSSWWSQRPRRNPAGIGVTGDTRNAPPADRSAWAWDGAVWRAGLSFPTWAVDAVPAHVGRLLAYATRPAQRTAEQVALVTRALAFRSLPSSYQGIAPTLRGLNGRWAVPGTTYASKIAQIANAMRGAT